MTTIQNHFLYTFPLRLTTQLDEGRKQRKTNQDNRSSVWDLDRVCPESMCTFNDGVSTSKITQKNKMWTLYKLWAGKEGGLYEGTRDITLKEFMEGITNYRAARAPVGASYPPPPQAVTSKPRYRQDIFPAKGKRVIIKLNQSIQRKLREEFISLFS